MSTKRYKPEQVVNILRQIEVEIANGKTTPLRPPLPGPPAPHELPALGFPPRQPPHDFLGTADSRHGPYGSLLPPPSASAPKTAPPGGDFLRHFSPSATSFNQVCFPLRPRLPRRERQCSGPPHHCPEEPPRQMTLRQQQPVVASMLNQPTSGLHQALLHAGQRPVVKPLGQRQPPPQVPEVVSDWLSNDRTTLEWNRWQLSRVIFTACLPSLIHCCAVPRIGQVD